jgi:hypothetical protein
MNGLRILLLMVGIAAAVPGLLLVSAGALGVNGALADVGPDENVSLGIKALWYSLPCLAISLAFIISSLMPRKIRASRTRLRNE